MTKVPKVKGCSACFFVKIGFIKIDPIKSVHPVNEYASRQQMIARLKVEAVFS